MDEWQMTVCAIALYADGYSPRQVGEGLDVDAVRAQKLISAGADAQARGDMGHMTQHCEPWSRDQTEGGD